MSGAPRFMQSTRASQEKLKPGEAKKPKQSMFAPSSSTSTGGSSSSAAAFTEMLLKEKRRKSLEHGSGTSSSGKGGFVPGTLHPFEPEASRDPRFGLALKDTVHAQPQAGGKKAEPTEAPPQQQQLVFPEIAFPPLHESFTNPQPIEAAVEEVDVRSPDDGVVVPHISAEGVVSPPPPPQDKVTVSASPARHPTPQPSPTHLETLDQVAQAEAALADMERLLQSTADGDDDAGSDPTLRRRREEDAIVASVLGSEALAASSPEEQQVLHALTMRDGRVDANQFAKLVQSVCKEAVAKLASTQAQTAATAAAQQQQSSAAAEASMLRSEVARLEAASAAMLANMHSIVSQMRSVVADPLFLEESLRRAEMNREFSTDLVAGRPEPAATPRTTAASAAHASAGALRSGLSSPELGIRREPGEPSPMVPEADVEDDESYPAVASAPSAAVAPMLINSPTRVQQLKQRLVRNGLRELLLDMTQEAAATADLLASSPAPLSRAAALQAEQEIRAAGLAPEDPKLQSKKEFDVPEHDPVQARIAALEAEEELEHELDDIVAELSREQQVLAQQRREKRAQEKKEREEEMAAKAAADVAAAAAASAASGASLPTVSSLSVATSPSNGLVSTRSSAALSPPPSTLNSARSPRLAELMKLELVKCVRQLEQIAARCAHAKAKGARRVSTTTHKSRTALSGSLHRGSATSRSVDASAAAGAAFAALSVQDEITANGVERGNEEAPTSDEEDFLSNEEDSDETSEGSDDSAVSDAEEVQAKPPPQHAHHKKRSSLRGPLPPLHAAPAKDKEKAASAEAAAATAAQAAAAAVAEAAAAAATAKAEAEAKAAEAQLKLEEQKLSLERERLAWEAEKLRMQQEHFLAQQQAASASKASADEAAAKASTAAAAAVAQVQAQAAQEAESKQKLELELEHMRMKLAMDAEQARMEQARRMLDEQVKEVAALKEAAEKAAALVQQQQAQQAAAAAAAPAPAPAPAPMPVPVHVTINHAPEGMRPGSSVAPAPGQLSAAELAAEQDGTTMKRNLAMYLAKREEKRQKRERRAARKAAKEATKASKRPSSRRNSLDGLPKIGAVSTTPADTALVRAGHHRHASSSAGGHLILDASLPSMEASPQVLGAIPVALARGSTRNLLQPWSAAELNTAVPLKLYPSLADVLSIPRAEERDEVLKTLSQYATHDQAYRAFLDPSGATTEALLAREIKEASRNLKDSAVNVVNELPWLVATPSLFLCLSLSLVDLHKLTFLTRPRPVVEIYSVRSGRPQLVFESEFAPGQCVSHDFAPMLLRLDEVCHGQLERDILIRVTSLSSASAAADLFVPSGNANAAAGAPVRTLVGEVWTNLHKLQTASKGAQFPVLRPRPPEKAHKGPKQKGTLLLRSEASLFVRSSAGLLAYPGAHPNRCLPFTYPAIYERKTECQICFTVQCRSLASLYDASFAREVALRSNGSGSSSRRNSLVKPPRLAVYLEFYRLEEEGVWSKKPLLRTEPIWAGSSLANLGALVPGSATKEDPHATLSWRPVQMDLFELCFGDVERNVLVRVLAEPGSLGLSPTLLASFQFQVTEVLNRRDAAVVVLDPRLAGSASASSASSVNSAKFLSEDACLASHPSASPTSPRGGSRNLGAASKASPQSLSGSAVVAGSDSLRPPCILFQRVHVYSSLASLPAFLERAGMAVVAQEDVEAQAARPGAKPLAKTISGLHQILIDQEKRRTGASNAGASGASHAARQAAEGQSAPSSRAAAATPSVAAAAMQTPTPGSRQQQRRPSLAVDVADEDEEKKSAADN